MRVALSLCIRYVSRFTVSPPLDWGLSCVCVCVFVCLCFGVCCLVCVCLLLTLSRSSQFDQRVVVDDRHSCHGAHGIG